MLVLGVATLDMAAAWGLECLDPSVIPEDLPLPFGAPEGASAPMPVPATPASSPLKPGEPTLRWQQLAWRLQHVRHPMGGPIHHAMLLPFRPQWSALWSHVEAEHMWLQQEWQAFTASILLAQQGQAAHNTQVAEGQQ